MARSRSRGAAQQSPVLVIVLVMLVILWIGTALMAYSFWAGQEDIAKKRDEWKEKAELREKNLNKEKVLRAINRRMAFGDVEDADKQDFQTYSKEKDVVDLIKPEQERGKEVGIEWKRDDKAGDQPSSNLVAEIKMLRKQLDEAKKKSDRETKGADAQKSDLQQAIALLKVQNDELTKALDATKQSTEKRFLDVDKMYKDQMKKLEDAIPDNTKSKEMIEQLTKDRDDLAAKLKATIDANKKEVERLKEKIGQVDLLAYDRAKAKVFQVLGQDTVVLDVGSADFVKPGLTFSVFTPDTYKPNAPRKGSVEVVRTLTDHTCEARVTEVAFPVRDPILKGDQLYNPAWSPGLKEHVAIAGIIDLTGDGRDNTAEFVRNLEKMGIVVDDYYDFSTSPPTRKGAGMTRERTSYLILGEKPNLDQGGGAKELDARTERKMNIREQVDKLEKEAIDKGITTVPARRFMALVGYKVPKVNTTDDYFGQAAKTTVKGGEKEGGEMKKEGEPKKDEEKKDAKKEDKEKEKDK